MPGHANDPIGRPLVIVFKKHIVVLVIELVSDQGMAFVGSVDPYLIGPSGFRFDP